MEYMIWSRVADLLRPASILLLSATTVLTVMSCGGSDDIATPDPPVPPQPKVETPIAFSGSFSEGGSENQSHARTRTTTALSDTHDTFNVWGYKNPTASTSETVMKNYTVNYVSNSAGTTTTNSRGWEYVDQQPSNGDKQTIKYWDFGAIAYRFFGYAGTGVTPDYTASNKVSLSFPVNAATADLTDLANATLYSKLCYKSAEDLATEYTQHVQLEFHHLYVKVRFMFTQSAPEDVVFNLEDKSFKPTPDDPEVTPKTIPMAGTFTVSYPLTGARQESWSVTPKSPGTEGTDYLTAFTQDYYEAAADETDADILANQKKWYVVLPAHGPGANGQGSYTLSVKIDNEPRTLVVPAEYMEWSPGYEYTYVFKITDAGGVVLDNVIVGFKEWTYKEDSKEIYNW